MSASSVSSLASASEDAILAMSTEKLKDYTLQLQRSVSRLEKENKQLRATCSTLRALANQDDVVLSDVIRKRIQLLETQLQSLHPDHDDVSHLQAQIEQLKLEKVKLENQLEQESESIVLRLNKEKRDLEQQAARLKTELNKASPEHAKAMLHHMAEEVVRLRYLLTHSGRASESQTSELPDMAALQMDNVKLKRKVAQLKEKVHALECSRAETESSFEIDDERMFNLSRSESPMLMHGHHNALSSSSLIPSCSPMFSHPLSSSPSSAMRSALISRPRSASNASSVSSRSGIVPYPMANASLRDSTHSDS